MNFTLIKRAALMYGITFGFAAFGAAYAPAEAKIVLFNNTIFTLDVSFPGRGQIIEHKKVIPNERATLGTLENVRGDIAYHTYGEWLSMGAQTYTVSHNKIAALAAQAGPNIDVVITISTSYGLYASQIKLESRPSGQASIYHADSLEANFPHAQKELQQLSRQATRWTLQDIVKLKPHLILGLYPEAPAPNIEEAAQRLRDKFKREQKGWSGFDSGVFAQLVAIVDQAEKNMLQARR